jgi:hypothetical protein
MRNKLIWTLLLGAMFGVSSSYAEKDRGGGHYVQDCSGQWMTLDEYRLYNPEKEFDVTVHPETKEAAKIITEAIENLSSENPELGKLVSGRFQGLHWYMSCQPLKLLEDYQLNTHERLNLIQGAIQDVEKNSVVWGEIENKNRSDLDKAKLIAHETFLNIFGVDVQRKFLAVTSLKLISYANKSIHGQWPEYKFTVQSISKKKTGYLNATIGKKSIARVECEENIPCELAVTINFLAIPNVKNLIFSFSGNFDTFRVLLNGEAIGTEEGTDGKFDTGTILRSKRPYTSN